MSATSASRLRIVSFNAGLLAPRYLGVQFFESPPFVARRIQALAAYLPTLGADIVCLQEVYAPEHVALLRRVLESSGHTILENPRGRFWQLSAGLLMATRLPVQSHVWHDFDAETWDETWFARRGMQEMRIAPPQSGTIALWNVHFTAGGLFQHPESPRVEAIRGRQVAQLLSIVRACDARHCLVVGDINAGPEASPANYAALLSAGFRDAALCAEHRPDPPVHTWSPQNRLARGGPHASSPAQRIDHILVRPSVSDAVRMTSFEIHFAAPVVDVPAGGRVTLSDHLAVLAELEIC